MEREQKIDLSEVKLVQGQARFLEEIGLWEPGPEKGRFAFRLSPSVLELNFKQKDELEEINNLMFSLGGLFDGANSLFDLTFNQRFVSKFMGSKVLRTLRCGIPKAEKEFLKIGDCQMPAICRLDLALAPTEQTQFKILEVEGDKTHAFGFVTIADLFGSQITGDAAPRFPGLIFAFRQLLGSGRYGNERPAILIVGRNEMFYETELKIFAEFCQRNLVPLVTLGEREVQVLPRGIGPIGSTFSTSLLVNLPDLTPSGKRGTGINSELLLDLVYSGEISCLIPPKRFLGNKGLLALVSNGDEDQELEKVLQDCFDPEKLARLREFIPQTFVLTRRNRALALAELDENPGGWVIKKSVSSGMRGVALPGGNRQRSMLGEAIQNPFNFVMQKKVNQETRVFKFTEPNNLNQIEEARMFMRISPFCAPRGVATVGVTARETPDVHGSRDSIQIPVIFKERIKE